MDENEASPNELEVFKDAIIAAEDLEEQIRMTKQLSTLAKHLGEDVTRTELIPFILENIDFHDEILYNLGDQLAQLLPLMGGYEHAQPVLELLRKLCNVDETIVRHKAVDTLKAIAIKLDGELLEKLFMPVLDALASEDWYTSKCSAAALIPTIYPRVKEETQVDLRHGFRVLVQDESPIVRREAAVSLVDLIPVLEKDCLLNEFIPVFHNISKDPMDSVRTMLMKIAIALCKHLNEKEIEEFVFGTIQSCADDSSWKIRHMLAHHIGEVQENIPFGKMRGKILEMYQKLIDDMQEEVRVKAVENLSSYCQNLKKSYEANNSGNNFEAVFQQSIVPHLKRLAKDPDDNVRLSLSSNIPTVSSIISESCFKSNIMPIIEHIFEQESCMAIQENMLQSLYSLPTYVDLTESLLSIRIVVRKLIMDSQANWRTRRSLLVAFMHITRTASREYFSENLKILYATLLGDPVFAVRKTAPVILPLLAKRYGIEWASENIIPFFRMFTKDCRYLYRYIPLFGINELVSPSVRRGKKEVYLNDLKQLSISEDNAVKKKVAEVLARVTMMVDTLKFKLQEEIIKDILSLNKSIDVFNEEDITLYADECIVTLQTNCDCDIFGIENGTMLDRHLYLDGLLALIIKEYLHILVELFDDPIVNVQIRSIQALNNIKEFIIKIDDELKETWVGEAMMILTAEEREQIEGLVHSELSKRQEDRIEEIDTEIMKDDTISRDPDDLSVDVLELQDREIPEIKVEEVDIETKIVDQKDTIVEEQKESGSTGMNEKPPFEVPESTNE